MKHPWLAIAIPVITGFIPASATPVQISKEAPIQFFLVERVRQGDTDQVNFTPDTEKAILAAIVNAGFNAQSDDETPLISKTTLKYSEMHTQGDTSAEFLGYVHMRSGVDGSMTFKTDKGQKVVLKTDVNEVHWLLDKKQAFAQARKAGAKYALLANVLVEEVHSPGALQRTYNVSLDASLHLAANGRAVRSFSDSLTRMGATASAAAKEAAQYLAKKMAQDMDAN
ncbi:MAG TPA: hypothetical protein VMV05_01255 [bacterium]|nr:hypothetical protein [bacterium]